MIFTILNLVFLVFVLTTANFAYKGRAFDKTSWSKVVLLSCWFVICAMLLLGLHFQKLFITLKFASITVFLITSLLWFTFPKLIRQFGVPPTSYLKDKKRKHQIYCPVWTPFHDDQVFRGIVSTGDIFISYLCDIVWIIHYGNHTFIYCNSSNYPSWKPSFYGL